MKISCLIAAYKAGNYINKALESIRAQEHSDWEVVVVEDGSRDQTEDLVKSFGSQVPQRVRYDNLGVNRGVATARNRLLELAEGESVAFIDADDWWTPQHLTRADRTFEGGADLVVSRIQLFDLDSAKPLETYAPLGALFETPLLTLFHTSAIMTSSCVALRRNVAQRAGTFDPAFRIGEDRDYWLRCASQGARFADSGEVTCFYSKHSASTMAKTLLWAEQEVAFYRKHHRMSGVSSSLRDEKLAHALLNYGRLLRSSEPAKSATVIAEAWRLYPFSVNLPVQWAASRLRQFQNRQ